MEELLDTAMPPGDKPRFPFLFFLLIAAAIGVAGLAFFFFSKAPADHQSLQRPESPVTTGAPTRKETEKPGTAGLPQESVPVSPHPVRSSHSETPENSAHHNKIKVISPGIIKVISADIDLPEISQDADTTVKAPLRLQTLNTQGQYRPTELPGLQLPVPVFAKRQKEPETSENNTGKERSFIWGLEWASNFPLSGRRTYPQDLKEKYGAYILAIPGIWAGRKIDSRQEVIFSIRPYFDYYSKNELLFRNNMSYIPPDTVPISQTYPQGRLLKIRSSSFTVAYHYRFAKNLTLGGELSQQHNWNALTNIRRLSPSGISPTVDSLEWLGRKDQFWNHLRRLNATAGLSLIYRTSSFSLGGSVLMPVFTTANVPSGGSRPLNARVFVRWQLNQPKKE